MRDEKPMFFLYCFERKQQLISADPNYRAERDTPGGMRAAAAAYSVRGAHRRRRHATREEEPGSGATEDYHSTPHSTTHGATDIRRPTGALRRGTRPVEKKVRDRGKTRDIRGSRRYQRRGRRAQASAQRAIEGTRAQISATKKLLPRKWYYLWLA